MNNFTFGPLRKLILLGSAPNFQEIIAGLSDQVEVVVVTAPDQAGSVDPGDARLVVASRIDGPEVADIIGTHAPGEVLAFSFGARWIIREELSKRLFSGRILNAHGTRLPQDRGGGGFSWRIMRGDRIGSITLHVIDDGIDTGPIVYAEPYVMPAHCRTPAELSADYFGRLTAAVVDVVRQGVGNTASLQALSQPDYLSTYYPRLMTNTHGWIDWSWRAEDIERFILSFDDPYPGARTIWREQVVTLKSCQLTASDVSHHPFQRGLVIRKGPGFLVVAMDTRSLVIESISSQDGTDVMADIALGDRLSTPSDLLDAAQSERVKVGPTQGRDIMDCLEGITCSPESVTVVISEDAAMRPANAMLQTVGEALRQTGFNVVPSSPARKPHH